MGQKGDKLSNEAELTVELLKEKLQVIDGVSSKKMFGGFGIFHDGKMFALVNSKGQTYLKSEETNKAKFDAWGASQHGKMPYFSLPKEVFKDHDKLISWVQDSISISK
jgi:DNA transformation protein